MKHWLPVLALAAIAMLGSAHEARGEAGREARAQALFADANRRLAIGSHEQRQYARAELIEAAALDPGRSDVALLLGQLYVEADLLHAARVLAQDLLAKDSGNAAAWLLQGQMWRRNWLLTSDVICRDRAIVHFARGARLAPQEPKGWTWLAPLLVDAREFEPARDVAVLAARAAPHDPSALVLLAATSQLTGDLATADRLFRTAVPRLPAAERERYDDVAVLLPPWVAEGYARLDSTGRAGWVDRFWAENDPDPVSAENEARLEYWARVTQALALYGPAHQGQWDARAQYYVRFGPPEGETVDPIAVRSAPEAPSSVSWSYPDLGFRLGMGTGSTMFGFPQDLSGTRLWARAVPESLARHRELFAVHHGWAVFHGLPPGVSPMDARFTIAQFQAADGVHLLAHAEAKGGVTDRLALAWVVLDSTLAPVARDGRDMSASACRPDQARAADFTATLSPGRYIVGMQVSGPDGDRAVARREILAAGPPRELAISDLVLSCSSPAQSIVPGSGVRLEPMTELFPFEGNLLNAYFEIYHLAQSDRGRAHFAYHCAVRPDVVDRRGWLSRVFLPAAEAAPIEMNRAETSAGPLRRQFLTVPLGLLPSGRYVVSVHVRDLESGATASTTTVFERKR